jgi:hypothetical protein
MAIDLSRLGREAEALRQAMQEREKASRAWAAAPTEKAKKLASLRLEKTYRELDLAKMRFLDAARAGR